jgi:hypothetical protein
MHCGIAAWRRWRCAKQHGAAGAAQNSRAAAAVRKLKGMGGGARPRVGRGRAVAGMGA